MDAMVTARMPQGKKEAAVAVLKELGLTASQAINEFFDLIIATRKLPLERPGEQAKTPERLYAEAEAWADSFPYVDLDEEWQSISIKEARAMRIADKFGITFDDGEAGA